MRKEILKALFELQDEKYQKFHSNLVPNIKSEKIIGVRIPKLRIYAKEIVKVYPNFLDDFFEYYDENKEDIYYEEKLLAGLVIGYSKFDFETWKNYIIMFLPCIDNWAICDSSCTTYKNLITKHQEEALGFLKEVLKNNSEYYQRFVVVMLMDYFLDDNYIDISIDLLISIDNNKYYVDKKEPLPYYIMMAVAWAFSVCFVKFPEKTEEILSQNLLNIDTQNKTIQKIRESNRVTKDEKNRLLKYKR